MLREVWGSEPPGDVVVAMRSQVLLAPPDQRQLHTFPERRLQRLLRRLHAMADKHDVPCDGMTIGALREAARRYHSVGR